MELTNDFRVAVPPETAWAVLTDVERIAPCMPGAQLQEIEGDEYRGVVKVKVGPITAQYKGAARFQEQDEAARRLVLRAEGRETRGQGNAAATITATLVPDGDGTRVSVVTDLTVTGKVAQFGRGVMADVSAKLLGQFVTCLESTVLAEDAAAPAPAPAAPAASAAPLPAPTDAPAVPDPQPEVDAAPRPPDAVAPAEPSEPVPASVTPQVRKVAHPEAKPVDLLDTAGAPVARRVAPILAVVAVGWLLRILLKRRKQ